MPAPLTADEFSALMAPLEPFEPAPRVAVALSGGADSMALALLSHTWAVARGGTAAALTVDHRLRPDSSAEAAQVAAWATAAGLSHTILVRTGDAPRGDIQAAARAARYALLEAWCRRAGILHLLLAHHRHDQAETLLLRLGRGSGVDGLAGMAAVEERRFVRLLRPLLPVDPDRLRATCRSAGQAWVEDPSNANHAYARVRLRRLLPSLAAEGLTVPRLAATAARLGRARAALEAEVAAAMVEAVVFHPAGFARLSPAALAAVPEEIGLRLLARLLAGIAGSDYGPRLERLEALADAVRRGLSAGRTLGGCRLVRDGEEVVVAREAGRMGPPVALVPGAEAHWDGRFRALVAAGAPSGLTLGALGPRGWGDLRRSGFRPPPLPGVVRPTLAAVYDQQGVCAVPHLRYNRRPGTPDVLQWIVAEPPSPLTVAGRCLV
ncbi:MAG: tRNA lysidine(34) synthetase TilS [Magnetospirillum sp.]|nr:tRNA lysidine(34) synthetase TilS [Magnetospirillum sp.]